MLSHVQLLATPWTVACQAPLSMGFFRPEYWSGLLIPPPGDFPDPGIEPTSLVSPALAGRSFTLCHLGNPYKVGRKPFLVVSCMERSGVDQVLRDSERELPFPPPPSRLCLLVSCLRILHGAYTHVLLL